MQSSKFLQQALKIIRENPRVFESLEEYDRTRKLAKTVYRERINLTIDQNVLKVFKRYCEENTINMSRLIEGFMKEELKKSFK